MSDSNKTAAAADKPDSKTTKPVEKAPAEKSTKPANKRPNKINLPYFSLLALLVSITALAVSAWLWQEQQKSKQYIEATLSQLRATLADTANQESVAALAAISQQKTSSLEANLNQISTHQQAINDSVAALNTAINRDQRAWVLAEIEYLMHIAMQRLQIESDYHAAIAAMKAADQRLEELADPALLPLRQQVSADIARLQTAPRVDLASMSLQLVNLATRVQRLGLTLKPAQNNAQVVTDHESKSPNAIPFVDVLWEKFNTMVTITENQDQQKRLLKTGVIKAKRNIHEFLTFARYAVLRKDETDFKSQLAQALDLYSATFDTSHEQSATLLNDLQQLATRSLLMTPPDISASLML